MAVIKLELDRRTKEENKRVVVSINIHSKREYVATGVRIYEGLWDKDSRRIIDYNGRDRVAAEDNRRIYHILDDILSIYKEYEYTDREITASELKDEYLERSNKAVRRRKAGDNLICCFNEYAESCDTKRTKRNYDYTLRRITEYYEECMLGKTIGKASLRDITLEWIEKFDKFLARKRAKNSRNLYHRCLHAVIRKANKKGMFKADPYLNFKIKNEQTIHRDLSIDTIRDIASLEIKHPVQRKNRDLFLLMTYMMGINAADLVKAKWSDVDNGRLIYKRAKTGTMYSVKLTDECMDIINRYRGEEYLISDGGKSSDAFGKAMSRAFKRIQKYHPELPHITSYFSRHSFATLAAELNLPIDVIGLALGHSWVTSSVTSVYVNFSLKKIDEAQRKVIDYILGK